jgi:hypothetical protein
MVPPSRQTFLLPLPLLLTLETSEAATKLASRRHYQHLSLVLSAFENPWD